MMVIESVEMKLPKSGEGIKNHFGNCQERGKLIPDSPEHYKRHLKKAKHDLARAAREFEDGCWDWTIIKAYYAIHHSANALLSKTKGLVSKDHNCLIVSLRFWNLIDEKLFSSLASIYDRFSDIGGIDLTFQLRKIGQYDVDKWEELTKGDASKVLEFAGLFVGYAEDALK